VQTEVIFLDCERSHCAIIRQDREVPLTYNDISTERSC
jgi:hypothetical protein